MGVLHNFPREKGVSRVMAQKTIGKGKEEEPAVTGSNLYAKIRGFLLRRHPFAKW